MHCDSILYNKLNHKINGLVSDGLINGELFLELPNNKELLDKLNLTPAFKALVEKRANEVNIADTLQSRDYFSICK